MQTNFSVEIDINFRHSGGAAEDVGSSSSESSLLVSGWQIHHFGRVAQHERRPRVHRYLG